MNCPEQTARNKRDLLTRKQLRRRVADKAETARAFFSQVGITGKPHNDIAIIAYAGPRSCGKLTKKC
ncbi:hypothetical protein AFLA_010717 [Aspergillus flavus NRRL3357]|nr:hypothetical protein AFLA_010717 [Aspergillus flavus NRRL3357]